MFKLFLKFNKWRLEWSKKRALKWIARANRMLKNNGYNRQAQRLFWREFINKGKIEL